MSVNDHKRLKGFDDLRVASNTCRNHKLGANKPLVSRLTRRTLKQSDHRTVGLEIESFDDISTQPIPKVRAAIWREGALTYIKFDS